MTAERIKQEAVALFADKGYEATTLTEIAHLVGIKKPSIYAHFSGKEDLFFSVFNEVLEEYIHIIEIIFRDIQGMKPPEQLYYIFEQLVNYFIKNPQKCLFWGRILLHPPFEIKEEINGNIAQVEQKLFPELENIFIEGIKLGMIKDGNVRDMVTAYRCMIKGYGVFAVYEGCDFDLSGFSGVWDIFWSGIKA